MLHDLPPFQENQIDYWQKEFECLFAVLQEKYDVIGLEDLVVEV